MQSQTRRSRALSHSQPCHAVPAIDLRRLLVTQRNGGLAESMYATGARRGLTPLEWTYGGRHCRPAVHDRPSNCRVDLKQHDGRTVGCSNMHQTDTYRLQFRLLGKYLALSIVVTDSRYHMSQSFVSLRVAFFLKERMLRVLS